MRPPLFYAHQRVKQGAALPSTPLIAALLLLSHVTHCILGRDPEIYRDYPRPPFL
jgi:hypothetical protein